MSAVEHRVKKVIGKHFGIVAEGLDDNLDLVYQFGADSLDQVTLTIKLEEEFNIGVTANDFFNLRSIQSISELVVSKLALTKSSDLCSS